MTTSGVIQDSKHAHAIHGSGAWLLPENSVWNLPAAGEVPCEIKTRGPWHLVTSLRALAVDGDGRIFGMRTLSGARQSGYDMEGRVSVGGKSYRGFTSSKLFEREDGTLCSVATIYVVHDDPFDAPNLDGLPDDELDAFVSKYWYAGGTRGDLKAYAWEIKMARTLRIEGKTAMALNCERCADEMYDKLPEWARW